MVYRVIQWATGEVGSNAVSAIVGHPDLELVGTWVHSHDKDGRDVGEICGLEPLGVRATRDKEALLATPADCVCYSIGRAWMRNGKEALIDELARILRSGKNVVNSTWPSLVNPRGIDQAIYDKLQQACLEGGTTFYTDGIDPGFGSAGLALSALTLSSNVRCVHMYEILNYATWDQPEMISFFGFGRPNLDNTMVATPGLLTDIFASSLRLVADAMGVQLDEITEEVEVIYADEILELPTTSVVPGTISGVKFRVNGRAQGTTRVVVEHITKLRDQDFPEVPFEGGGGYRAVVEGEPCAKLDLTLYQHNKDHGHAALASVGMAIVNAIPQVCEAPPGVLTCLDLRPHPAKLPRR